jgi:hypothetical protein
MRTHLLMLRWLSLGDSIREVAEVGGYSELQVKEIAKC